jgi:hypothetical protein
MPTDFDRADEKLRQAELLCDHLRWQSAKIARDMRRAAGRERDYQFVLETFFSASLNAVQSAFFVLDETGGPAFKQIYSEWRGQLLDQSGRTRFNALMNLRGRDVHFGVLPSEALAKMIPMEDHGALYGNEHNAAILGP